MYLKGRGKKTSYRMLLHRSCIAYRRGNVISSLTLVRLHLDSPAYANNNKSKIKQNVPCSVYNNNVIFHFLTNICLRIYPSRKKLNQYFFSFFFQCLNISDVNELKFCTLFSIKDLFYNVHFFFNNILIRHT